MPKLENLISYIEFNYFDIKKSSKIYSKILDSSIWSYTDSRKYGRCYTAKVTNEYIKYGIRQISLKFWSEVIIFFHTEGMFQTARQLTHLEMELGKQYHVDLEHGVFKMLDFGGEKCIENHKYYSKDLCTQEVFEKNVLGKYGCTSPFGRNKTLICKGIIHK